jgi:hypothetical protein
MCKQNQAQHSAYNSNPLRPDANVGTTGTMHHSQMVNNDMGAGGVQLPMSGVVPLAEPPPKRQKTVNLQVTYVAALLHCHEECVLSPAGAPRCS